METGELCRRHGIARGCFYRWKGKYGGMEVSEAKRLRQLEEENHQLKHTVVELLLDKRALQAVVARKWFYSALDTREWNPRLEGFGIGYIFPHWGIGKCCDKNVISSMVTTGQSRSERVRAHFW